ncbi:protein of unknown function [Arthrobacter woluwensis]|uniref:DUF4439 domain-containing protein n=2 Tax=Arthrobacter woluwensis TaxID=156980 RepID=A0A1H4RS31_9MICC|nr:protein of unknown function [Arthrobacter woluwensis]
MVMKNAGKTGRTGTVLRRLGASAVVLATVLGLSAAVSQVLSPAPVDAAAQAPQAVLATSTGELAAQARALASTTAPKAAPLATTLEHQFAALTPPAPSSVRPSQHLSPSTGPTTLPQLVTAVRTSASDLLDQARRDPDGGLARLYTAAAQGRLDALGPLLPSGAPSGTDLVKPGAGAPSASCSSGASSPDADATPAPTTAATASVSGTADAGPASSASAAPTPSPRAVDATQAVLRAGRHLAYLYQVAEVRLDHEARADADRFETAVRSSGSDAAAWVRAACAQPAVPEAGYELPVTFLKAPATGLGAVEEEMANAALDLVAVSEGDLRAWAMEQYLAAGSRARHWDPTAGAGSALPGVPEAASASPYGPPSATPSSSSR